MNIPQMKTRGDLKERGLGERKRKEVWEGKLVQVRRWKVKCVQSEEGKGKLHADAGKTEVIPLMQK